MAEPSVGGAAAVSALFGCLILWNAACFRVTRFRVYLMLGLSCIFRCIGYAVRAAEIQSFSNAKAGTYLALTSAGFGVAMAVICLLLGCWWKNSGAGARLQWLSVGSRLLIAPIITLGPVSGAVLAGLLYGTSNPAVVPHAHRLRLAIVWGLLSVLILLTGICLLGTLLAWRGQRDLKRAANPGQQGRGLDPDMLILVMLACCALLLISASFRTASVYHPALANSDDIVYPVEVLPELLEVLLLLWHKLMPRAALGRGFASWWAATHGGDHGNDSSGSGCMAAGAEEGKTGVSKMAAPLPKNSGAVSDG